MTDVLNVSLTTLVDGVEIPAYAYPGDAGMDLRAIEHLELRPFERALVSTGLAIAIPEGYAGFVQPRSGLAIKQGVTVLNTPGLIDSHYRGELKVALINLDSSNVFEVNPGDRIAQLVIQKVERVAWNVVDSLDETERGEGGFGSSGVA
ncbi:MAG: dUTP diphosphatase [Slackia sp.]|nr:dUTP diphosphatase [Slackia sp.]